MGVIRNLLNPLENELWRLNVPELTLTMVAITIIQWWIGGLPNLLISMGKLTACFAVVMFLTYYSKKAWLIYTLPSLAMLGIGRIMRNKMLMSANAPFYQLVVPFLLASLTILKLNKLVHSKHVKYARLATIATLGIICLIDMRFYKGVSCLQSCVVAILFHQISMINWIAVTKKIMYSLGDELNDARDIYGVDDIAAGATDAIMACKERNWNNLIRSGLKILVRVPKIAQDSIRAYRWWNEPSLVKMKNLDRAIEIAYQNGACDEKTQMEIERIFNYMDIITSVISIALYSHKMSSVWAILPILALWYVEWYFITPAAVTKTWKSFAKSYYVITSRMFAVRNTIKRTTENIHAIGNAGGNAVANHPYLTFLGVLGSGAVVASGVFLTRRK